MILFIAGVLISLSMLLAFCCCKASGAVSQQERELGID